MSTTSPHSEARLTAPLLLEIGCEEVPAGVVPVAAKALLDALLATLDGAGISHGEGSWLGAPRRLTAHIEGVATGQPDREEIVTGPPMRAARDAAGQWTKAAEGFAKGQGVEVSALAVQETPKGAYVVAHKQLAGRASAVVLAEALPDILRNLPFPKKMRWAREREPFIRPVHWLVALLGETVLDVAFAGVQAGSSSWGHRFYANRPTDVPAELAGYLAALREVRVEADPEVRRQRIRVGISELAADAGGTWIEDEATLEVVTYLTEWPTPLLGEFDPAFLEIPAPVIRTTLRENQKLFTLLGSDGKLLPRFITVANTLTEASRPVVARGNARVVSARLADARFFHREDTKQRLDTRRATLDDRIWLAGLGSIGDKVTRIERLSAAIAQRLCPEQTVAVARAAQLCKCDLSTRMVFEFPELQGLVGADYARIDGEEPAVARAIAEHYQPRFAGDAVPSDSIGASVSLADKIDTIVGCFALGMQPSGTQDPFALRRQALGVLRILGEAGQALPLSELVDLAVQAVSGVVQTAKPVPAEQLGADVQRFLRGRLSSFYANDFPADLVEAVLDAGYDRLPTVAPSLRALDRLRSGEGFAPLAAAFKRVGNIVRKSGGELPPGTAVQPERFELDAERALYAAVAHVSERVNDDIARGLYDDALAQLVAIKPAVDGFFDGVMVMTDDVAVRHNRLALLRSCADLFARLADFARIQA